jgi:hypothetical protein
LFKIIKTSSGLYILDKHYDTFQVKDLIATGPLPAKLPAWDWYTISGHTVIGEELSCVTIEADIRLESPSSVGSITDNSITITATGIGDPSYTHVEFKCVNYNNYFDYNGVGQVILVDPRTQQVVSPVNLIN